MSETAVVRVQALRFAYNAKPVLDLPQFEIAPEQRVALVGPSGCGKTTFLHLLAGILPCATGSIEVLGQRVDGMSDAARRQFRATQLGLIFQEFELLDYLTARENLGLPWRLHPGLARQQDREQRIQTVATRLGIAELLDRRPAQLSQGERQRVAVGRALAPAPRLLLGDEPTGNLDPDNARLSLDLLFQQAAEEKAAVLVVTHDHSLLHLFDEVVRL